MWLQDVQPVDSPDNKGAKVTSCRQQPIYDGFAISASKAGGPVEQFDPATSGARWVATGVKAEYFHLAAPSSLDAL